MSDRVHLVDEVGDPLCAEMVALDPLPDEEFWAHVFSRYQDHRDYDPDDDPNIPDRATYELEARLAGSPCGPPSKPGRA